MGKKTLLLVSLLVALEAALVAGGRHDGLLGAPVNISRDDRGLQKVIVFATCFYNHQVNDAFLFKVSAVDKAQRQLVQGLRYIVDMQISRTVCRKHEGKDPKNCDFQPEGPLHQVVWCHIEVWLVPWERTTNVQAFLCADTSTSSNLHPLTQTPPESHPCDEELY